MWRHNARMSACTHLDEIRPVEPSGNGCVECLQLGMHWVHLRRCTSGAVTSAAATTRRGGHATGHFHSDAAPDHPVVSSPTRTGTTATSTSITFEMDEPQPSPSVPRSPRPPHRRRPRVHRRRCLVPARNRRAQGLVHVGLGLLDADRSDPARGRAANDLACPARCKSRAACRSFRGAATREKRIDSLGLWVRTRLAPQRIRRRSPCIGRRRLRRRTSAVERRARSSAHAHRTQRGPTTFASAITLARANGLEITVHGGGHSFAGHGVLDDGLMIDLSPITAVTVDPGTRQGVWRRHHLGATQRRDPGARPRRARGCREPYRRGGIDARRRHRLAVAQARAVVRQPRIGDRRHRRREYRERIGERERRLALGVPRRRSGDFGVVTEFEFRAPSRGPARERRALLLGRRVRCPSTLGAHHATIAGLPPDAGAQIIGVNAPPLPFIPEEYHFQPGCMLAIVGWGSPEEHTAMVAPAHEGVPPLFEFITPLPYTMLQQMIDDEHRAVGDPRVREGVLPRRPERRHNSGDRRAAAAQGVADVDHASVPDRRHVLHDPADDDTAFGGSRDSKWLVNIFAVADPIPSSSRRIRAWVRTFWDALQPYTSGSGSYVNFLNDPGDKSTSTRRTAPRSTTGSLSSRRSTTPTTSSTATRTSSRQCPCRGRVERTHRAGRNVHDKIAGVPIRELRHDLTARVDQHGESRHVLVERRAGLRRRIAIHSP